MVAQPHSKPTPHRFSLPDESLASETKRTLRILVAVAAPVGALLFAIEAAFGKRTIQLLMMDANAVNGAAFFHGLISTAGTAIWMGSALLILLSILLPRSRADAPFLILMLILTLALSLDDLMQLHEIVLPTYLGVSESVTYAVYLALTLAALVVSRRTILENEPLLLTASLAFFAASVAADTVLADMPLLWRLSGFAFEDGCKLIAIVLWTTYFFRYPLRKLR